MSACGKIEVYLNQGKGALEAAVDFARLREVAASLPGVTTVHDGSRREEHGALAGRLERGETERVVLAGFGDDVHLAAFARLLSDKGGGEALFAAADLRHLARGLPKQAATALAEAALRQAVARVAATPAAALAEQASPPDVLVIGQGAAALRAAAELGSTGRKAVLVTEDPSLGRTALGGAANEDERATLAALVAAAESASEVMTTTEVVKVEKHDNGFRALLRGANGSAEWRSFGAVIAAPEPGFAPRFKEYKLAAGPSVASLTAFEETLADPSRLAKVLPPGDKRTVVFLLGLRRDAQVVTSARVLRAALKVAELGGPVARVVTDNLKVGGAGLEALAQHARQKGVVVFKLQSPALPAAEPREGKTVLRFRSDILADDIELVADLVVVDEDLVPAPVLRTLEEGLRLEPGPAGMLQPDNVHMTPVGTSHEGLLALGPARGVFDLQSGVVDGDAAAAEVHRLLAPEATLRVKTEVDDGRCVACLTCYRLCPHDAIRFQDVPHFSPLFCQGCGICSGACPQNAITVTASPDARLAAEIEAAAAAPRPAGKPTFLALCCRRSAAEALKLARQLGEELPEGLRTVELPCAGRLDEEHVLSALLAGFDGVMVLGCHEDNCRSLRGNMHARNRLGWLGPRLAAVGLEPERLRFATVASNMSAETARHCREFAATLVELGEPGSRKTSVAETEAARASN